MLVHSAGLQSLCIVVATGFGFVVLVEVFVKDIFVLRVGSIPGHIIYRRAKVIAIVGHLNVGHRSIKHRG